jgi:hypothetical protein
VVFKKDSAGRDPGVTGAGYIHMTRHLIELMLQPVRTAYASSEISARCKTFVILAFSESVPGAESLFRPLEDG